MWQDWDLSLCGLALVLLLAVILVLTAVSPFPGLMGRFVQVSICLILLLLIAVVLQAIVSSWTRNRLGQRPTRTRRVLSMLLPFIAMAFVASSVVMVFGGLIPSVGRYATLHVPMWIWRFIWIGTAAPMLWRFFTAPRATNAAHSREVNG